MNEVIMIKLIAVFGTMITVMVTENIFPKAKNMVGEKFKRIVKNFMLFGINTIISPLIVIPITVFAAGAFAWREALFGSVMSHWGFLIFDILLLDFMIYWWHRFNHEVKFLWRFHKVHHLDEFLDVSTAVRFHFGEVIFSSFARAIFIIATDISLTAVLIAETLLLLSSIFQHSNLRLSEALERKLNLVIVTPAWHWLHHHQKQVDTDSNYGNILTCWDRLFGSKNKGKRWLEMPIGLDKQPDVGFMKLLLVPFKS